MRGAEYRQQMSCVCLLGTSCSLVTFYIQCSGRNLTNLLRLQPFLGLFNLLSCATLELSFVAVTAVVVHLVFAQLAFCFT